MLLIEKDTTPSFFVWMPGLSTYKTHRANNTNLIAQQGAVVPTSDATIFRINLFGSETSNLGGLELFWFNAAGSCIGQKECQIVKALPGDLAAAERDAIAAATLTLASGIEDGLTLQKAMRVLVSFTAGKSSGGGLSWSFRDWNDTKDRLNYALTGNGGRDNVTHDLS